MGAALLAAAAILLSTLSATWLPLSDAQPNNLCFEKLYNSFLPNVTVYMTEHPVGGRAAVGLQNGLIYLMTLPRPGNTTLMQIRSTYLDLRGRVAITPGLGLLSFAFHPRFEKFGRFFVAYTCDRRVNKDCQAPLFCNPLSACKAPTSPFTLIVAEYRAGKNPKFKGSLIPTETRKILAIARPHSINIGGHIWFGNDNHLYVASGDGGNWNNGPDPYGLGQNMNGVYGKILRLDVDKLDAGLNYAIPKDNPFNATGQNPLIYALGFRNPFRCDEDSVTKRLACGDQGSNIAEEINLVTPRGNYGWGNFQGGRYIKGAPFLSPSYPGRMTWPAISYSHQSINASGEVIGGLFYRSSLNPCLQGTFLFADANRLYWRANLLGGPLRIQRLMTTCSTPRNCPAVGRPVSWAKDFSGNAYLLTYRGIYRVANQTACGIPCSA